jgi:hypothetical protein
MKSILLILTAGIAALSTTQAGTILTSGFDGITTSNVTTTGLAGYGFFSANSPSVNNGLFGGTATTTSGLFSTISNQNVTPTVLTTVVGIDATLNDLRAATGAQTPVGGITFGGVQAYGAYGGFPAGAGDLWSLDFADLAAGEYAISLYMGHSSNSRTFGLVADLTGAATNTVNSGPISGLESTAGSGTGNFTAFRYDINFTAAANDDLTLKLTSTAGGAAGGAFFAGYTVTAIPEPSAALLGGLGMLALLRRRRA